MFGADRVDDVRADGCSRSSSKRRRLMPTCFGGKTTIKQSLMSVNGQRASVASVLRADVMPVHRPAAAAAARDNESRKRSLTQSTSTYRLMYRQCSSVRRPEQVRYDRESQMTSVTTVSKCHVDCHSTMTSNDRHHYTLARHLTSCHDSGYDGTCCDLTASPAQLPCRGSLTVLAPESLAIC